MSEEIHPSPFPASGRKRKTRPTSSSVGYASQTMRTIMRVPARKRGNPYRAVHKFKRTSGTFGPLITDGINPATYGFNFSFNDIPGYTEFTTLFDFYKITGIRIRVMPFTQNGSESTNNAFNSFNPPMYFAVDTSDGSSLPTADSILEYDTLKIGWLWKGMDFYFKPKFSDATGAQRAGWVATTNSAVDWYGLKVFIPPTGGSSAKATILVTYYVQCKNVK
jgi:hypothetical protein